MGSPRVFFQVSHLTCTFLDAWSESSRDLIQFLTHYLPEDPYTSEELPLHLPRLPDVIAQRRRQEGLSKERTLIGLGHSAGATAM